MLNFDFFHHFVFFSAHFFSIWPVLWFIFVYHIEIERLCCVFVFTEKIHMCRMLMLVLYDSALSLKTNKIFTFAFYLFCRAFLFQSQMLCAHQNQTEISFHKTPKKDDFFFLDFHLPLFDRLFSLSCFINLYRRYISNGPLLVVRFPPHLLWITWKDFLNCTNTQKIHYSFMGINWSEK